MRAQLDDAHERGEPIAALWASEATIYGRFGYGLASLLRRDRAAARARRVRAAVEPSGGCGSSSVTRRSRLFPPIYDAVAAETPGDVRALAGVVGDQGARAIPRRAVTAGAPRRRIVVEEDGVPVGLCRLPAPPVVRPQLVDRTYQRDRGDRRVAGRDARRCGAISSTSTGLPDVEAGLLPGRPPALPPPRRVEADELHRRATHSGCASSTSARRSPRGGTRPTARSSSTSRDGFCRWNEGRWRLAEGTARTDRGAGPTSALPSDGARLGLSRRLHLSPSSARQVASRRCSRGRSRGRTDSSAADRAPWCPEIF